VTIDGSCSVDVSASLEVSFGKFVAIDASSRDLMCLFGTERKFDDVVIFDGSKYGDAISCYTLQEIENDISFCFGYGASFSFVS
jgi:hypothetical protein